MRLFEAIIDANNRAVAGDQNAGLRPDDFADELPVVALTCIDPRLNAYFPNALALPAERFIWLRNAGNIITGPMSSTMRSLALACAVKGGKEIAIIGHTDCQVCKVTTIQLIDRFKALGVERSAMPDDLNGFFGLFSSERQNVIKACDTVRSSPLIGAQVPVHGLLINIETGKLDWVVNGYQTAPAQARPAATDLPALSAFKSLGNFDMGEMKFPEGKIGDLAKGIVQEAADLKMKVAEQVQAAAPVVESVKNAAGQVADYAAKNWPKAPPPVPPKMAPPPLPRPRRR